MKLYIGNCTKQVQDFTYRIPGTASQRVQRIEIGSQIRISSDLSTPEIQSIVDQHHKYGLVAVGDIDRTKPFIGMCYSVDTPITVEKLRRAFAHNADVLNERGRELRQEAAVAVNHHIEQAAGENGPAVKSLEMTVQEENPGTIEDHPAINEGVRVMRDAPPPSGSRGGRGNRGRRSAAA